MRLKTVRPAQGVQWLRQGFKVYFRYPLGFAALFVSFLFGALLLMLVPWAGVVLVLMSLPLLTLGFMLATRGAIEGHAPRIAAFVAPLRVLPARRNALLQLGLAYALATIAIITVADWADGGKFAALQDAMASAKTSPETLDALLFDSQLHLGLLLRFGLAGLLSLPFWHAPALIHWDGQGVGQALFSSTLACWRARGAFAAYLLGWGLVIGLFGVLVNLVFALLGSPHMVGVAALPAALLFSTVFYTSLYFSFADSFDAAA